MLRGFLLSVWIAASALGCAGRSVIEEAPDAGEDIDAGPTPIEDAGPPPLMYSDKLDLLLVVDNSRNLDLAHALLAETVPYLLDRLTSPACVNGLGNVVAVTPSTSDPCPLGVRDFAPLRDIHVGVISTSLGGHGADTCSPSSVTYNETQNDAAHLLARAPDSTVIPTYAEQGFLAWDPGQTKAPPGEAVLSTLAARLADMVRGVGTQGCGFESQLESIYRFLVEPNPYASIGVEAGQAVPFGTDEVLLKQRADFLRDDSAVAIVLLTDENDCSTIDGGQFFFSNQALEANGQAFHLPRARSECEADPSHACCASCAQNTPAGCPPNESDPACLLPPLDPVEDPINLRCFDQKRRFGIDFLYPIDRYVRGLNARFVPDRDGNLVANPLFMGERGPELVVLAGIVGVPWQDIASDPKSIAFGFRPALQIDWGLLLGDPAAGAPPFDPLMIESIDARSGVNPPTGLPLAPPESTSALANLINGHERVVQARDDLQYACIYRRPQPKDCSGGPPDCECVPGNIDTNPLCQGADGGYSSAQRFSGALPSTRELTLLSRLGTQAVAASVCATETSDTGHPAYAYKPAVDALLHTLRQRLTPAPETDDDEGE